MPVGVGLSKLWVAVQGARVVAARCGGFHDLVGVPVSGSHALSGCARGWVQRCRFRWVFGLVVGSGLRVENVRIPDAQLLLATYTVSRCPLVTGCFAWCG